MAPRTSATCSCGGALRVPKVTSKAIWENLIVKYLTSVGVPGFSYNGKDKRFHGIKGFSFVRIAPKADGGWANVPYQFHRYETERANGNPHPVIMFLTGRNNGSEVNNTYVLTRLETFAPMLKTMIEAEPTRYLGRE